MVIRVQYMNKLKTYRDVPLVKILAGIRRCGKSTILDMLQEDLLQSGITADHIISMRYTSEDYDEGMTANDMYHEIKNKIAYEGRYYL
ncbi:MAG: AAA family ATPase, partial [Clostridiales bacterium]|nr:AAA family ATPase [Clostridiales bacterium]